MLVHHREDEEPDVDIDQVVDADVDVAPADEFDDPEAAANAAEVANQEVSVADVAAYDAGASERPGSGDADEVAASLLRQLRVEIDLADDQVAVRPRTSDEVQCMGCFLIVAKRLVVDPAGPFCADCT